MNKQEQIMKSFAENSYGDGVVDVSKEAFDDADGGIDGIDFIDKDDDQMISQKIAKATATKKKQQQKTNVDKNENQKFKPKLKSKPKSSNKAKPQQPLTNRQKANNKRKSKEQQYIEEYFSGTKTNNNGNSDSGSEAELIKVRARSFFSCIFKIQQFTGAIEIGHPIQNSCHLWKALFRKGEKKPNWNNLSKLFHP